MSDDSSGQITRMTQFSVLLTRDLISNTKLDALSDITYFSNHIIIIMVTAFETLRETISLESYMLLSRFSIHYYKNICSHV